MKSRPLFSLASMILHIKQPDFLRREELLADYRIGGYHPVNIGDLLNERYEIRRKLGWGEYSTVWLAHDERTDNYCSIKILAGIASISSKIHELELLLHVAKYDPSHPGNSRVIRLLDHFRHLGPYGRHLCLVTELLSESVQSLTHYTERHTIFTPVVKGITRDVLHGLAYLHGSGIIHTDLKLDNFLVEIENMNALVHQTLESSPPKIYPGVELPDGRTINYAASEPIYMPFEDVQAHKPVRVKLVDLGVACWESKVTEYLIDVVQPPALRAPEVYVGAGWDTKCDIWSLGLLVLEMLRGESILPTLAKEEGYLELTVLFLICLFGRLPMDLLEKGRFSAKYFKPDGSFLYDVPEAAAGIPKWTWLVDDFEGKLHDDEVRNLRSFLEAMLRLRPEDRWTAGQLVKHEWVSTETRFTK